MSDPKIIVSLDFSETKQVLKITERLDPALCRVKIGKELFTSAGPEIVRLIIKQGYDVFLDLKFHDIPSTVAKACSAAADLGIWMMNVHASGGKQMLIQAIESLSKRKKRPILIAVTVLTSMSKNDLKQIGVNKDPSEQVNTLAALANDCGLDGVVCSAREATALKKQFGKNFILVTPGIRPTGAEHHDQTRIMTPADAIRAGSDYLVIGRPITRADEPGKVLQTIHYEIENVIRET